MFNHNHYKKVPLFLLLGPPQKQSWPEGSLGQEMSLVFVLMCSDFCFD